MIILEGCDNSGKSTLAQQLSKALDTVVRHSVRPAPGMTPVQLLEHSSRLLRPQRAILDRVYAISENVYGPVLRGGSQFHDKAPEALLDLYQRPYLVVYCRPSTETILRNNGRDQMPGVVENHRKLVERYDQVMHDLTRFSQCRVIRYDWQDKTQLPALVETCANYLKAYDQSRWSSVFMG